MSCCKCPEKTWIELEGIHYCRRHGEARLAELRMAKAPPTRRELTDGAVQMKMRTEGRWVTVEGFIQEMEIRREPAAVATYARDTVAVPAATEVLHMRIVPTKILQHKEEPTL